MRPVLDIKSNHQAPTSRMIFSLFLTNILGQGQRLGSSCRLDGLYKSSYNTIVVTEEVKPMC